MCVRAYFILGQYSASSENFARFTNATFALSTEATPFAFKRLLNYRDVAF